MKKSNKIILAFTLLTSTLAMGQNPLMIPETITGTEVNLTLQNGQHPFFDGQITETMGANGNILGPTLILNQGDLINFHVDNQIGEVTTIHWHGLHVAPENDGGPHTVIEPNTIWNPSFTIMDKAATFWYHPHLHQHTNEHVSKGIAGMIIIKDDEEAALDLPRTYGVDDFPLVLQTKDFDSNNQIVVMSNSDDVAMVNATVDPVLDVPAQVIRYRVLNGSSQRAFNIGLSNGQSFYQIASDGGLLETPLSMQRLMLAPAERAEILIDLTGMEGETIFIQSFASELPNGIYGSSSPGMMTFMSLDGYNPNPLNGGDFDLLQLDIIAQNENPVTSIPTDLVTLEVIEESSANTTRSLTFSPSQMGPNQLNGTFQINNASFNMNTINYTVPFNNIEIWEITNQSAISHPFHIHDIQFRILTRNNVAPPANEQGRKDVVLVKPGETVRFIGKFDDFYNDEVPYMYHCHLLTHEDGGMMGQFVVAGPNSIAENDLSDAFVLYPNPANESIFIDFDQNSIDLDRITIYDALGKKVKDIQTTLLNNKIKIDGLSSGTYLIELLVEDNRTIKKIIIE